MPPRCPNCARHPSRCIECEDRGFRKAIAAITETVELHKRCIGDNLNHSCAMQISWKLDELNKGAL